MYILVLWIVKDYESTIIFTTCNLKEVLIQNLNTSHSKLQGLDRSQILLNKNKLIQITDDEARFKTHENGEMTFEVVDLD